MNDYRDDIDELFYDGIEAHNELPSADVWKEVETELNKQDVTVYKKKYGKLKKSFALLLLLFMGFLVYDILSTYVFDGKGTAIKNDDVPSTQSVEQSKINSINEKRTVKTSQNVTNTKEGQKTSGAAKETDVVIPVSDDQEKIQKGLVTDLSAERKDISQQNEVKDEIAPLTSIKDKGIIDIDAAGNKEINKDESNKEEIVLSSKKKNDIPEAEQTPVNNKKEVDQEVIKNDNDLLLTQLPYTTAYISQLRNQSPGLFTMPMIITEDGKKNLLNGLWPAAENLTEPSLLYIREPIVLKKINSSKEPRFFLSASYAPYTSFDVFTDNRTNRFNNSNSASTGAGSSGGSTGGALGISGARRNENFDFIRESESGSRAYSAGIKVGYWLDKKFSVETGLNFTTVTTNLAPKYIYARNDAGKVGFDLHTTMGSAFLFPGRATSIAPNAGDSMWLSNSRNMARYLGIPFTIGYKLASSKRFSLETFAGGQYNILLRGSTWGILNEGTATQSYVSSDLKSLKASYFSLLAGFNAEMRLNRHFSFIVSPTGQFGLSYMNQLQGTLVRTRSNYLGLSGGMRFRF